MSKSDFPGTGIEIEERTTPKTKRPSMFVVLVHNDPFTPREFVVEVLKRFFIKTPEQALKIMITAHTNGLAAVGTYTKEIAETRASKANEYSRSEGRPLTFSVQEEEI